jgi:TRAP-type mannitol/chloroaromatic compound transport system substrate-binding protein
MNRRQLLGKLALGSAAAAATACGVADGDGTGGARPQRAPAVRSDRRVRWRLVSSYPRGLDTIFGGAEMLAERVRALTDGAFEIRAYPAGEIVPGLQVMDAVQQGTAQLGQTASYYFTGKQPAVVFDTCVPFGLDHRQQQAWLDEGGGREGIDRVFADFGIVTLPGGGTGTQMGGWFRRPIGSVADLRGLKMRIPGLGGEVMSRLGVTVQVLAGGDIYPALESGAIDATEWVGPYDDEKLGFHKIARHYYYPGWWEPGPSLAVLVNRAAWDSLPATHREVLRVAAREASVRMQSRYDARNPPALRRLLAAGVELRPFPAEMMTAARRIADELLAESAGKDASFRRIFDSWQAFRRDAFSWFGTCELAYAEFAFPRPAGQRSRPAATAAP